MMKFWTLHLKIRLGKQENQQVRFTPKTALIHIEVIVRFTLLRCFEISS